jgi:23S rRNA (guanosine2251-2'-O)-methyltransferase
MRYSYCMSRHIIIIAHDLRSAHNVGSLLRTADGLGAEEVILSGYTPYPLQADDNRLPHLAQKIHHQIAKTALGAEQSQQWRHAEDIKEVLSQLRADGFSVMALEQSTGSVSLPTYQPPSKVALLLGSEVEGIEPKVLALCDGCLEIPMLGQKESFNVVQAAAMALYHCRFWPFH